MISYIEADGSRRTVSVNFPLPITGGGGSGAAAGQVQGNAANGAADVGNPVKVGGYASNAPPAAVAAGQRVNQWFGLYGQTNTQIVDSAGNAVPTQGTVSTDAVTNAVPALLAASRGSVFNGTSWDRARGDTTGAYVVHKGGSSLAAAQVAVSTASTLVVAARPGRQKVTLTSTAAFWVGPTGVTSSSGFPVAANAAITLDTAAAVYAVGGAAITVAVIETF